MIKKSLHYFLSCQSPALNPLSDIALWIPFIHVAFGRHLYFYVLPVYIQELVLGYNVLTFFGRVRTRPTVSV